MAHYKDMLFKDRIKLMNSKLEVRPTDIIPMINYAWDRSFAREESNKKEAIYECGWYTYKNRNLLLHPESFQLFTYDVNV